MLVHDFLSTSTARTPDKTALVCCRQRMSYAQLECRTNQLARALMAAGVKRGDRVVVLERNSIKAVIALLAVLKAGAVVVPLHPTTRSGKLAWIVNNCAAVALITGRAGARCVQRIGRRLRSLSTIVLSQTAEDHLDYYQELSFDHIFADADASPVRTAVTGEDLACLMYRSCSSGQSRGVMCGHGNVVFACDAMIACLNNSADDIVINVLPFAFDYGLYQMLMVLRFGGTLVIYDAFGPAAGILRVIERERVTGFPLVPALMTVLLDLSFRSFDLASLRYITSTPVMLPVAHLLALRNRLPHVRFYSIYGSTECKDALYLPPEYPPSGSQWAGIPVAGTQAWIEADDHRRLGPGEVGELVVRGPHVMQGYWDDDALSSRRFAVGAVPGESLFRCGDLFYQDPQGIFHFVAHADDTIDSGGFSVAPAEIEAVISELSAVRACAVVGVPHPVLGQALKACLVLAEPDLTELQVNRHCRSRLESFLVPRIIEFVRELPQDRRIAQPAAGHRAGSRAGTRVR
ncbi:MAG: AMP-dependent synthetase [Spirochaetaceae bacterium]|nr:MAG: AMP-dependent synthetase [Spirochaetaceae bacterium]